MLATQSIYIYTYVHIYIYDVRYLYQQTGRLKWCYILLYSFNGISWDYTVYWRCLTILALFNDGLCPSSQRSSREFSHALSDERQAGPRRSMVQQGHASQHLAAALHAVGSGRNGQ